MTVDIGGAAAALQEAQADFAHQHEVVGLFHSLEKKIVAGIGRHFQQGEGTPGRGFLFFVEEGIEHALGIFWLFDERQKGIETLRTVDGRGFLGGEFQEQGIGDIQLPFRQPHSGCFEKGA